MPPSNATAPLKTPIEPAAAGTLDQHAPSEQQAVIQVSTVAPNPITQVG